MKSFLAYFPWKAVLLMLALYILLPFDLPERAMRSSQIADVFASVEG